MIHILSAKNGHDPDFNMERRVVKNLCMNAKCIAPGAKRKIKLKP
jgi:hypothetical protein